MQLRQGVTRIALTSHYHPEMEPLDAFLDRREVAFKALQEVCPPQLNLKKGCEVYFIPAILQMDAGQLCLWWNDGKVMAHAGFPNGLGTTEEAVREKLQTNTTGHSAGNHRHMILYQEKPIGEMNYSEVSADTCEIGIKICDFSMQNKGLGKIALSMFLAALFGTYRKIILDTNLRNERAQHVYEQLGFEKVRVRENSWKDQLGNWQSAVDYELTEEKFRPYL
jgi:RimJ/RimL family protein N-acetyltransferase